MAAADIQLIMFCAISSLVGVYPYVFRVKESIYDEIKVIYITPTPYLQDDHHLSTKTNMKYNSLNQI